MIGIYYFKDIGVLKNELQFVLDHEIIQGGEYQINDGIKRMDGLRQNFQNRNCRRMDGLWQ